MDSTVTPLHGKKIKILGWSVALSCLGFALFNLWFEASDRFDTGSYAEYATGIAVMNWLVIAVKLAGAAVALLASASRPRLLRPFLTSSLVWGAFATLGVYAAGSMAQAVVLAVTDAQRIEVSGIAYVLCFALGASAFGTLAISHSRRFHTGRAPIVIGVIGAPLLLGLLLVAVPQTLAALGIMPSI